MMQENITYVEVPAADLIDDTLNWAVAKVLGIEDVWLSSPQLRKQYRFDGDYAQGGPLLGKYRVEFQDRDPIWLARVKAGEEYILASGHSHLVAGMRAIVTKELGDIVQIPQQLIT